MTEGIMEKNFTKFEIGNETYYFTKKQLTSNWTPDTIYRYLCPSKAYKSRVRVEVIDDKTKILSVLEEVRKQNGNLGIETKTKKTEPINEYKVNTELTIPLITKLEERGYAIGGILEERFANDWFAFGVYQKENKLGIVWLYNEVRNASPYKRWVFTIPKTKFVFNSRLKICLEKFIAESKPPEIPIGI
ncbi:MAG: hypothetical protein AABW88_02705, partial [Nanoarchaeota archaeon]